MIDNRKNGHL